MATGRTLDRFKRIYVDGYDLSGFTRSCGPLSVEFEEDDMTMWGDTVKNYSHGQAQVNLGTLNAVFDNTATTGLHALMGTSGVERVVTVAQGIRAVPAQGDPCFNGQFMQDAYQVGEDGGAVVVTIPWSGWAGDGVTKAYPVGWGVLLHANAAATAANTAIGVDDFGAASAHGGYFIYHVTAGDAGNVTLKVQDAAVNLNASFADLSGATSGLITASAGVSGIVALSPTATVRQFLRWQLVLGTALTVTFVSAFVRSQL